MSSHDDRPWKAEDMLRTVIEDAGDDAESTRRRIERFFDQIESPGDDDSPTASVAPDMPEAGGEDAPDRRALPSEPPVEVPNHELIRCLGVGGFGQVWLARHTLTEHYRACKLIPADKSIELDGLRRLKQRVPSHPNLFPIEDVGKAGDWLYCVMPLADNAATDHAVLDSTSYEPLTLGVYLQRHGRRSSEEAAAIGLELAGAIRHLHEHGVTHGDIKPANIMRLGGRWTLADYGLARELSAPTGEGHTPGYTPPEGPGSTMADQFALGVVLMQLVTGWPSGMLKEFKEAPLERLRLDEHGPRLVVTIRRAAAADPDERFGSMDELIEALRPVASGGSGAVVHRARTALIALAAAVVVMIAVVALVSRNAPAPSAPDAPAIAGTAAPGVESFEVRRYRYDPITDTTFATGPISADNPAAREDDDVTVHASFAAPSFVYLVSLDADGTVRPRVPATPTETPRAIERLDYPSLPAGSADDVLYNLGAGPGTQGFMLLVSKSPLPAWSDWIASRGEPTWTRESLPAILFDGAETRHLSAARDPMPRRGRMMLDPIDWARSQGDLAAVRFIAFPVLPGEED